MPLGNPISLTRNVASREITETATEGQTLFTVTGGYRINKIDVYRNGVLLSDTNDYTAADGSSVTLSDSASAGDEVVFRIYDDFRVADAIVSAASSQTINGNLTVTGELNLGNSLSIANLNVTGISSFAGIATADGSGIQVSGAVTATKFVGDGSDLTGVTSGVELLEGGTSVGTAITAINFSGASITAPNSGLSTVTINQTLTIGVRSGSAVTFAITNSTFNVVGRGGNILRS